jgi:AbrB family looped-hinge helix DNA binding protein
MRMTIKGQVTIPKHIRDALGIEPGDEVDFELEGDAARISRRRKRTGREIVEAMRGTATASRGIPTDEIMKWLRG